MSKKDYYEILGLDKNASDTDIKKAYRKLAKEHHPDVNSSVDSEEKFKLISEAYEHLSDADKKSNYDRFGHSGKPDSSYGWDVSDIFREFYGANRTIKRKGRNARVAFNLTLEEMFAGIDKTIKYNINVECNTCDGVGGSTSRCNTCHGRGSITRTMGNMFQSYTCPNCQGQGLIIDKVCSDCDGGTNKEEIEVEVVGIPKGIEHGQKVEILGKGHRINDGENGDLEILIQQIEHEDFIRHGNDLIHIVKVPYFNMILGCEIEVPIIDGGKIKTKIPKCSPINSKLRIAGKGMPILNSDRRGNLIIHLELILPSEVSESEVSLLEDIKKLYE